MKAAVIQMNSNSRVEDNLELAKQLLTQAADQGAALAVLPENFSQMPLSEKQRLQATEPFSQGPIQQFLSQISSELGLWIIAGTISITAKTENKVRSASLVYNDKGQCVSRYDKQHLFDVDLPNGESYKESSYIEPGNQTRLVDTPIGKIGLSICYDLRFPEYYRRLSEQGADIVTVPSAFTYTTGKAHWLTLLRARAIENQVYILAPGQTGQHDNGRSTFGHSVIFDPWGEQIDLLEAGNGVISAIIDHDRIHQVRQQIPCLKHRKL